MAFAKTAVAAPPRKQRRILRSLGLGLITGAADDDCSAIGTFAQAGAKFGYAFLWMAPLLLPMMVSVVYLSGKLGQVTGEGLFAVIRRHYSRPFLYLVLVGAVVGNTIEAGADIGAMAAALQMFIPVSAKIIAVVIALTILVVQIWGSYTFIRNTLRVLALSLLAYVVSAFLAHPDWPQVAKSTLLPTVRSGKDFLAMTVAMIGASLSAYIYTWQSNEEVEEKIAAGQSELHDRKGTTRAELKTSLWDVIVGMVFSSSIMYFVVLATGATLFHAGKTEITSAADAAQALRPFAGHVAGLLFALGMIGVGALAVPVMTTGAAYDLCQSFGWEYGLSRKPWKAKGFYIAIIFFSGVAVGLNFTGINPMKALVFAGVVQGFSTPPLLLLILLMTNRQRIMGQRTNHRVMNVLGWATTVVIFLASAALLIRWVT